MPNCAPNLYSLAQLACSVCYRKSSLSFTSISHEMAQTMSSSYFLCYYINICGALNTYMYTCPKLSQGVISLTGANDIQTKAIYISFQSKWMDLLKIKGWVANSFDIYSFSTFVRANFTSKIKLITQLLRHTTYFIIFKPLSSFPLFFFLLYHLILT